MMSEKTNPAGEAARRSKGGEDGLGSNSDIGTKLKALYGSVQEEAIPERLLDLLEKLDQVEGQAAEMRSKG